ncbi:MAG: C10 family peptidase, partial [Victivallales bacterium]|nr:C10 family peptidase [Victivallales bacterium]
MKTRLNLLQLTVLFIITVLAVVHAADVGKDDIVAAARKWIADNAIFQAESPNAVPEKAAQMTDADGKIMPLWLVELAPSGYLVMSADDTLPPVVAFNTKGVFDMPEGHPLPSMLNRQGEIFHTELGKPLTRGNELAAENQARWNALLNRTRAESTTPSTIVTAPLLTTKWNQNAPYNYFCPSGNSYVERAVSGCVPTAIAQMLKYHEWPIAGSGKKSYTDAEGNIQKTLTADFSFPYDWAAMTDNYEEKEERNYGSAELAVARLFMEMGVLVEANYEIGETGAHVHNIHTLMSQYLDYSSSSVFGDSRSGYVGYTAQSTIYSRMRTDMIEKRPAFV